MIVLLETLLRISQGESGLSAESIEKLRNLKSPLHIEVFVTPTCPYCPAAVRLAHQLAIESDLITADMVEATEFPDLVQRYDVRGVPKTVINSTASIEGSLPESDYIDEIVSSASAAKEALAGKQTEAVRNEEGGKSMSEFAPRCILCPVDLSSASPTVLRWARLFAETYHAKVEVLHADWLEYPPYFLLSQTEELAAEERGHRAALDKILAKLVQDRLGPIAHHNITILEGHSIEAILKYAEEHHPDLIVMGSHGRNGVARMRLGSVAENVMRQAAVPTLVVGTFADKSAPPGISRVLCPVSFTEHGFRSLELSAEVAARFGAELVVMHSVEQE